MTPQERHRIELRGMVLLGVVVSILFIIDLVRSSVEIDEDKRFMIRCVIAGFVLFAVGVKATIWWKRRQKWSKPPKIWE